MSQALLAPSLSQAGPAVQIAETVQHAGWHSFDNITTLAGLAGTFYWPENPLLPSQITFTFTPGLEGYQGNFINRRGTFTFNAFDVGQSKLRGPVKVWIESSDAFGRSTATASNTLTIYPKS